MSSELPATEPQSSEPQSNSMAKVIYILILVSTLVGLTGIIALVMAYVMKEDANETLATHYRYQIRTMWIGLLYTVIGSLLLQFGIGLLILILTFVWVVVRVAKGLKWLERGTPVANVETWFF